MAHNVHNETVVPGSFARRQARALFSTLVLTLWVLGFTLFIFYKYIFEHFACRLQFVPPYPRFGG